MRIAVSFLVQIALGLWLSLAVATAALAHEVRPAVADVEVGADRVVLQIRLAAEPLVAGIDLQGIENTNDSPLSAVNDALRVLPPETLELRLREAWPGLAAQVQLQSDGARLTPDLTGVVVGATGDVALPRDTVLTIEAALPEGTAPVQVGWAAEFGPLVVRQVGDGDDLYADIVEGGTLSAPLPRDGVVEETAWETFVRFIILGFEHIIPKGLDHILFVLGLFFFALKLGPLLWQVTAFTAAHTVTLAMASLGLVTVPASVVEPLIAVSIVYVAIENIRGDGTMSRTRFAVVFAFGLLHGLGFASVLSELDLPASAFVVGLIAFNIGVEIGQLAVIALAALLLALPFGRQPWYRSFIAIPGSLVIAAIGAWWVVERTLL